MLDQAYDHCQRVARERAKNFHVAFRTLPRGKRRAIYAAYAYCRLCDDIADGDLSIERKRLALAEVRRDLDAALSGEPRAAELAPEFIALADAAETFSIPGDHFRRILEGVESDLTKTRFADFAELRDYCHKVASAVGLACIAVFGYEDPRAEGYAADMGIALQLTNIIRDMREDAERDRIYIPQDEMARFGYSERDLMAGVVNDAFRRLARFQAERAGDYYERSRPLFALLSPESRTCARALHAAYRAILKRAEAADYDVMSRRVGLSAGEKFALVARLWIGGIAPRLPLIGRFVR